MKTRLFIFIAVLLLPSVARAGNFVYSDNFHVFVPPEAGEQFALDVLSQAERLRKEIAQNWLGEELPRGKGKTIIAVDFSAEERGLTWAIDSRDRKMHNIYLYTSREAVLGGLLAHEIAHIVLATKYPHPGRLPVWLEEGIASRYDGEWRVAQHKRMLASFSRSGWPRLEAVLDRKKIPGSDAAAYAASASLVEFLLSRGDKATLLRFAQSARKAGPDQALRRYYKIDSVAALQQAWQNWAGRKLAMSGTEKSAQIASR